MFRSASAVLVVLAGRDAQAQLAAVGTPLAHRYIVVYRNAMVPPDVEYRVHASSGQLRNAAVQRKEGMGIALVQASAEADDAAAIAALRSQPGVDAVVHDRMVNAHRIVLRPVELPVSDHITPLADRISVGGPTSPSSSPIAATPVAPFDTYYNSPQGWAVRQVGGFGAAVPGGPARGPWDVTMGAGVRIAILDSGLDANHPDIAPNLIYALSEIDQTAATGMPSACDDGSPQDQQGHGTWAASLAAGALGPGTGLVVGVAPYATLLNIKVLERMPDPSVTASDAVSQCATGQASGLLSWVIQGIQDAVAQHAQVISMSLGTLVDLETGEGAGLQAVFNRVTYAASQAGAVLIASAGNEGFDLSNPRYIELPAQARNVLAIVASTNPACAENLKAGATCAPGPVTLPYYSNFGAPLNALAAPGGSYPEGISPNPDTAVSGWIRGACSAGIANTADGPPADSAHSLGCFNLGHTQYVQAMGTSASAPLAAGVAALLFAANPGWTPGQVVAAMRASAIGSASLPAAPQLQPPW